MPHDAGTTPRFYWAVMVAAIFVVAGTYWSILQVLRTAVGERIGFRVEVHETRDEDISPSLRPLMKQAVADGSHRRLTYKVTLM